MPAYPRLAQLAARAKDSDAESVFRNEVIPYLIDAWLSDYHTLPGGGDIVETSAARFSYLFDVAAGRLIAAWGVSAGRHAGPRDRSRMAGHPLGAGPRYHRGHAIPHTLGGPTDINLVPQLAKVNVGAFRALEIRAVATPGSLYFTYWEYPRSASQTPTRVEQGLLVPGRPPEIRTHGN